MHQPNESLAAEQSSSYPTRRELRAVAEPQYRTRRELRQAAESERHLGRASLEGFLKDQRSGLDPEHRVLMDQMCSMLDQMPNRTDHPNAA